MIREGQFTADVETPRLSSDVPEKFAGAPIALQLVGKHFRDEQTLAAAELVSKIVQGN